MKVYGLLVHMPTQLADSRSQPINKLTQQMVKSLTLEVNSPTYADKSTHWHIMCIPIFVVFWTI